MTSTTLKIIIAVAVLAGQLLFAGTHRVEAASGATYGNGRIIRDNRANPVPWKLPAHSHNHKTRYRR
jgi:hypothetical protein